MTSYSQLMTPESASRPASMMLEMACCLPIHRAALAILLSPAPMLSKQRRNLGLPVPQPRDASSGNLKLQVVSENTKLSTLNGGLGVGSGTFTVRDSAGKSAVVEIDVDTKTVGQVIDELNASGQESTLESMTPATAS